MIDIDVLCVRTFYLLNFRWRCTKVASHYAQTICHDVEMFMHFGNTIQNSTVFFMIFLTLIFSTYGYCNL